MSLAPRPLSLTVSACTGKKPPVPRRLPRRRPAPFPGQRRPRRRRRRGRRPCRPSDPRRPGRHGQDPRSSTTAGIEVINGPDSPLKPVFFAYDSDELDDAARQILTANAEVLKTYPTWVVTIEGHCDERGTAEYNLALGDRRALAAKNYLVSLGIPADRLRTVSYGKEFPFDPGHDEAAWAKNRRAHFMLTVKQ